MTEYLTFGKYKGYTINDIVHCDKLYAEKLAHKQNKLSENQYHLLKILLNSVKHYYKYDYILSQAYYATTQYYDFCDDVQAYLSRLYVLPIKTIRKIVHLQLDYDMMLFGNTRSIKYNDIIINLPTFLHFGHKYVELRELQRRQIMDDLYYAYLIPSQRFAHSWYYLVDYLDQSIRNDFMYNKYPVMGYWTISLNKTAQDADGFTEIDRCWEICINNFDYLFRFGDGFYDAIINSRRPESKLLSYTDATIRLLCSDLHRVDFINRFRSIYKYDWPIFWTSFNRKHIYDYDDLYSGDVSLP